MKMDTIRDFGAWLWKLVLLLWGMFWAASFKMKAVVTVLAVIFGLWIFSALPSRQTVANALPDYVPRAEMEKATSSLQRDIDGLNADIHQIRIELDAIETKLAEPPPAPITTGSVKSKKRR